MPVLWAVRDGIVFVSLIGEYTFDEIRAAVANAYADARAPAKAPLLIDGRSSLVHLSPEEIQLRSKWYCDLLERGVTTRCAMIVGESEYRQEIVAQGMAPLQEAGLPVRSFAQFADAWFWLKTTGEASSADRS